MWTRRTRGHQTHTARAPSSLLTHVDGSSTAKKKAAELRPATLQVRRGGVDGQYSLSACPRPEGCRWQPPADAFGLSTEGCPGTLHAGRNRICGITCGPFPGFCACADDMRTWNCTLAGQRVPVCVTPRPYKSEGLGAATGSLVVRLRASMTSALSPSATVVSPRRVIVSQAAVYAG